MDQFTVSFVIDGFLGNTQTLTAGEIESHIRWFLENVNNAMHWTLDVIDTGTGEIIAGVNESGGVYLSSVIEDILFADITGFFFKE